jgi:hypothetical protein
MKFLQTCNLDNIVLAISGYKMRGRFIKIFLGLEKKFKYGYYLHLLSCKLHSDMVSFK